MIRKIIIATSAGLLAVTTAAQSEDTEATWLGLLYGVKLRHDSHMVSCDLAPIDLTKLAERRNALYRPGREAENADAQRAIIKILSLDMNVTQTRLSKFCADVYGVAARMGLHK